MLRARRNPLGGAGEAERDKQEGPGGDNRVDEEERGNEGHAGLNASPSLRGLPATSRS